MLVFGAVTVRRNDDLCLSRHKTAHEIQDNFLEECDIQAAVCQNLLLKIKDVIIIF